MSAHETITLPIDALLKAMHGEIEVPRQLGHVRLIEQIGRGGMGVVWRGHDKMLARQVAVKFLLGAACDPGDPEFQRFLEGARAAAKVRHPALTTIYQADLVEGVPYLVMEYVEGLSLSEQLRRGGPLTLAEALAVLEPVCAAVEALHEHGIIHRDLKPANVLLDRDGGVFVTDFGLTCPRKPAGTTARMIAGTPAYMAPEMFDGVASLWSDVYALGVTAFELLTASRPFEAAPVDLRKKRRHEALPTVALRERGSSPDLINVLERSTHENPIFRYKSARLFLRALQEATRGTLAPSSTADLAGLVARCRAGPQQPTPEPPSARTPSSYFERLSELAVQKYGQRDPGSEKPATDVEVRDRGDAERELSPPTGGPLSEPARTVRENPLFNLWLSGLPEMELFESDLQRRLAFSDFQEARETRRQLLRPFLSRRFWLDVCVGALIVGTVVMNMKLIFKRLAMPAPLEKIVFWVVYMAALWFVIRRNARRLWQQPLRLKLIEQGVPVCLGCGYCLRGLPLESARCPECGRAFDERVRELLSQAGSMSGAPVADSALLKPDMHEPGFPHARRRARRAMLITGLVMILMAGATFSIAYDYPPMQNWYWRAMIIGIGVSGFILGLIGQRRYRIYR